MYHVSAQGIDEHMINVHYYYRLIKAKCRWHICKCSQITTWTCTTPESNNNNKLLWVYFILHPKWYDPWHFFAGVPFKLSFKISCKVNKIIITATRWLQRPIRAFRLSGNNLHPSALSNYCSYWEPKENEKKSTLAEAGWQKHGSHIAATSPSHTYFRLKCKTITALDISKQTNKM